MKEQTAKKCPVCGRTYAGSPALSRRDNATEICPDCGGREALEDTGIRPRSQREIMIRMVKAKYLPRTRVRLLYMNDRQAPPVGTEGTVRGVDDIGSVMVAWDNGSGLNVVLEEDEIKIVE